MNAYELADELLRDNTQLTVTSAYMLRQQADRIAELEKFNKAILKKGGYPYEKSNPIAWMSPDGKVSTTEGILFHIPLYTTPQTKPLSDEEIWNWFKENTALTKESALRIARAILRKAWD